MLPWMDKRIISRCLYILITALPYLSPTALMFDTTVPLYDGFLFDFINLVPYLSTYFRPLYEKTLEHRSRLFNAEEQS